MFNTTAQCKICNSPMEVKFSLTILNKYDVNYLECKGCVSLSVENPFWLDEAYANSHLTDQDVSVAQRSLHNFALQYLCSKFLRKKEIIDWGCGDALSVRLARDYGLDAYGFDQFAKQSYPKTQIPKSVNSTQIVSLFEVLEHIHDPISFFKDVLKFKPEIILLSTQRYHSKREKNWSYLAPHHGQHVYFYSNETLAAIAKKIGMHYYGFGNFGIMSVEKISIIKIFILRIILSSKILRICRGVILMLPSRKMWRDL